MPNPWVSLRCDQLIPVNKAVNKKVQWEKGWRRRRKKRLYVPMIKYLSYVQNQRLRSI
jgi:hypothetical protein